MLKNTIKFLFEKKNETEKKKKKKKKYLGFNVLMFQQILHNAILFAVLY